MNFICGSNFHLRLLGYDWILIIVLKNLSYIFFALFSGSYGTKFINTFHLTYSVLDLGRVPWKKCLFKMNLSQINCLRVADLLPKRKMSNYNAI